MGEVLFSGLLRSGWSSDRLIATARRPERARELTERYGSAPSTTTRPCAEADVTRSPSSPRTPACCYDFKYYLTKQVLKQTLSHSQWMKLTALYQAADHPQQAFSWWRPETAEQIERCLLHNDRDAFRDLLPRLRRELSDTPSPESPLDRPSFRARDAARLLRAHRPSDRSVGPHIRR